MRRERQRKRTETVLQWFLWLCFLWLNTSEKKNISIIKNWPFIHTSDRDFAQLQFSGKYYTNSLVCARVYKQTTNYSYFMARSLKQTIIISIVIMCPRYFYKDEEQWLHTHSLRVWHRGLGLYGDTDYGCHAGHLFASSHTVFVEHIYLWWLKVNISVHADHAARPAHLNRAVKRNTRTLLALTLSNSGGLSRISLYWTTNDSPE